MIVLWCKLQPVETRVTVDGTIPGMWVKGMSKPTWEIAPSTFAQIFLIGGLVTGMPGTFPIWCQKVVGFISPNHQLRDTREKTGGRFSCWFPLKLTQYWRASSTQKKDEPPKELEPLHRAPDGSLRSHQIKKALADDGEDFGLLLLAGVRSGQQPQHPLERVARPFFFAWSTRVSLYIYKFLSFSRVGVQTETKGNLFCVEYPRFFLVNPKPLSGVP